MRAELQRIGREYNQWDRVSDIYLSAVDEFGPIENAVALHHEVARFRDELGQIDKSEQLYNAILRLKSDDVTALDRIEQIYRSQERWGDLSNLLERRTSGPTESLPHGPERRAKFRELAELYESSSRSPTRRSTRWSGSSPRRRRGRARARRATPTRKIARLDRGADAYESLVRLYSRVGLWANVVESLQHQADLTRDTGGCATCACASPRSTRRSWGSPSAPSRRTKRCWSRSRRSRGAGRPRSPARGARPLRGLQVILGRRAATATGVERREIVRRRAKILEEKLGNPEAAASALRELGAEAIADDEMMAALIRNLRRAGLAHEAARVLTRRSRWSARRQRRAGTRSRVAELSLELSLLKLDD